MPEARNLQEEKTQVSVIIPVYNSEQYVEDAVMSVINQDGVTKELILVDDGSSDASGAICDRLAKQYDFVKVIHKPNGGICSARNAGLKEARGAYVTFCDNDDRMLPGCLSENYDLASENDADLVRYCRKREMLDGKKVIGETVSGGFPKAVISKAEIPSYYPEIKKSRGGIWTGLYRTAFLRQYGIQFDESMRYGYEDHMFNLHCYRSAEKIVLNPKVYYLWIQRVGHSTTRKFDLNVVTSMGKCIRYEYDLMTDLGVHRLIPEFWNYLMAWEYVSELFERLAPEGSSNLTDRMRREAFRDFYQDNRTLFKGSVKSAKYILQRDRKLFIVWECFIHHLAWPLYCLIYKVLHQKKH